MSFIKNLQVTINFEKDTAGLQTQRLLKQDLNTFFSNLSGSILGILGVAGFVMSLVEQKIETIKRKRLKSYSLHRIFYTRDKLFYQIFGESIMHNYRNTENILPLNQPNHIQLEDSQLEISRNNQPGEPLNVTSSAVSYGSAINTKNMRKILPLDSLIYLK